jgi:uncharacterized protein YjbJ (UPF0337 family)
MEPTARQSQEKWGELTDDDLNKVEGQFDQLVSVIQEKYELTRAKAEVNELLTSE